MSDNQIKEMKEILLSPGRLVADLFGAIILGLGLAKQLKGIDIIPPDWRFEGYGIIFIFGGTVLLGLSMIQFVRRIRDIQQRRRS